MPRSPDYMYRVSERLSEVMDDIGVNKRQWIKRQTTMRSIENITTIISKKGMTPFIFGSKTEGSTTLGLNSDLDMLTKFDTFVIQSMSERKSQVVSLLMIQNENISPGYCYLQFIKSDFSLPENFNDKGSQMIEHLVIDSEGRLLLENTCLTCTYPTSTLGNIIKKKTHGPALTIYAVPLSIDLVPSFYRKSSPHQVTSWIQKQKGCKWPTEKDLEKCRHSGCFVVPVGGNVSHVPKLEWRISTSLQERYLMFSLNITQLRCYVLMKMILKTHIDPHVKDVLSSFMCKNVLLYCIANSSHDWHTGNLLSYLHLCLFMLKECVVQRNCPHLMIPENNLLAGRMTDKQRGEILNIINNLMEKDEEFLYEIQIDDLGRRLKMKLNMIYPCPDIAPATDISLEISRGLEQLAAGVLSKYLMNFLEKIKHESIEMAKLHLFLELKKLEIRRGEYNLQSACELLIPLVISTLDSVIASSNIASHTATSDLALYYLEAGKESYAVLGRLKLVSILYCSGDKERAEQELRICQKHYELLLPDTTCKCNKGSVCKCDDYDEAAIKSNLSIFPIFLQCEINCVPHELRYEILKFYIKEDRKMGTQEEIKGMDVIVVDPVFYLYFLQYKTYGQLQRGNEQEEAEKNLIQRYTNEPTLPNRDTLLNVLGQLFEQANRQPLACQCYIWSLQKVLRNNAARFLLCIQLFKQWKQYNPL